MFIFSLFYGYFLAVSYFHYGHNLTLGIFRNVQLPQITRQTIKNFFYIEFRIDYDTFNAVARTFFSN